MFDRIGIISNLKSRAARLALLELVAYLATQKRRIIVDEGCAEWLDGAGHAVCAPGELGRNCDLVIAIGGDGTMLMASHLLCDFNVPLLGVNLGRVGFLADIPADAIQRDMAAILAGRHVEDRRFLLSGRVWRGDQCVFEGYAFNDVIIQKWNSARLIELETYIDGAFVHRHRSDGMIVATPTGSTAYALSGGGPVVHPAVDALLLAPICPHSLTNRPLVVNGASQIEVISATRAVGHARLTLDGESRLELAPGDRVRIKKKDKKIRLIHPPEHDQFHILREKLHWSK